VAGEHRVGFFVDVVVCVSLTSHLHVIYGNAVAGSVSGAHHVVYHLAVGFGVSGSGSGGRVVVVGPRGVRQGDGRDVTTWHVTTFFVGETGAVSGGLPAATPSHEEEGETG